VVLVTCGFITVRPSAVSAQATAYGLTIPDAHPRLWWNAERIARAKTWLDANPFAPKPEDGLGFATRCVIAGDAADCHAAVAYAMNIVCRNAACNSPG
jgi:hypothetical protein